MNRPYGTRPRSLDLFAPDGLGIEEILTALREAPACKTFLAEVQALFQIGKNVFNITFAHKEENNDIPTRKGFLWATRDGINTPKGRITFELPTPPAQRITIRGIPTEIDNEDIKQDLEKLGCGFVCRMSRLLIKGTRIMNGLRDIWIKNYVPHKIPERMRFDNVDCRVFLPPEEMKQTCSKCLENGHPSPICPNQIVCWYCKEQGHRQSLCSKRNREFPLPKEPSNNDRKKTPMVRNVDETPKDKENKQQNKENKTSTQESESKKRPFHQVCSDSSAESAKNDNTEVDRTKKTLKQRKRPQEQETSDTSVEIVRDSTTPENNDQRIETDETTETDTEGTNDTDTEKEEGSPRRPPKSLYTVTRTNGHWSPRNQNELRFYEGDTLYLLKDKRNTDRMVMGIRKEDWDKGRDIKGLVCDPEFIKKHPGITRENMDTIGSRNDK